MREPVAAVQRLAELLLRDVSRAVGGAVAEVVAAEGYDAGQGAVLLRVSEVDARVVPHFPR